MGVVERSNKLSKHLLRDLERLKKEILNVGSMVEDATNKAITSLVSRRLELAREVIEGDGEIDRKELEVEEECLKILALHQPVAADLRFIVAAMKVNNDLERMGDLAVNIAERATYLSSHEPIPIPFDFMDMVKKVQIMVRESLDSLVNRDGVLARSVCKKDNEIDRANRHMFAVLQKEMGENPRIIERAIHILSASRYLERIADHATNIAEDVVFMVEGEMIRHHFEDFAKSKE